ncbi:hypothetical protein GGR52DRAFT_543161 [Hypoxylon sp. FL1284]|nr:hypothetical protein GGR52DRAFT_543161 [Hypoxylon sp. FL1284]
MMSARHPRNEVVFAPSGATHSGALSVFLAGTTTPTADRDWRALMTELLADLPVTVINPYRPDWDSSWREEMDCQPFREQVQWELGMQDFADVIVFYFDPSTLAPITLLELGLAARTAKPIVVCPQGYQKRGNVQIVCEVHGLMIVESFESVKTEIIARMPAESH